MYGMTTRSVHQYVLGVYEKEGLKEEEATKLQVSGRSRSFLNCDWMFVSFWVVFAIALGHLFSFRFFFSLR